MKILTTKKVKKFSPDWGWIDQVQYFLFGWHFWTENYISEPLEESVEALEYRAAMSLRAEAHKAIWHSELPHISNESFDDFQKEVAQYPTRF